jgi:1-acyl-sn-glycerol-3-phosphate acyltransferase
MQKMKRTRPWFYYFGNWFLRNAFRLLLRVDVRGLERVPREGALIVAISHSSFLDPLLAGAYLPRDVIPMAKIEAFNYPVLGLIVRLYGAFPVRRGEADMSAFKTALRVLQDGSAIVMAPEGHRSETGALQQGREGAIMLSLRTGAPILPVAVWGGKAFWRNLAHLRRTPMWFYVGEPVMPAVRATKPTREWVGQLSDELMFCIAELMPPEMHGYYAGKTRTTHYLRPYRAMGASHSPRRDSKEVVLS